MCSSIHQIRTGRSPGMSNQIRLTDHSRLSSRGAVRSTPSGTHRRVRAVTANAGKARSSKRQRESRSAVGKCLRDYGTSQTAKLKPKDMQKGSTPCSLPRRNLRRVTFDIEGCRDHQQFKRATMATCTEEWPTSRRAVNS